MWNWMRIGFVVLLLMCSAPALAVLDASPATGLSVAMGEELSDVGDSGCYVAMGAVTPTYWEEDNEVAGLQTAASRVGEKTIEADKYHGWLPASWTTNCLFTPLTSTE